MITVDPRSYLPPFEQVRDQIRGRVGTGELPVGSRLPPVRRLAADLGVAPNTVARAYRELEREGVLDGRGARGTFVAAPPQQPERTAEPPASGEPGGDVRNSVRDLVRRARDTGMDRAAVLALVSREWDAASVTAGEEHR
nr:GntR family transcriptional regulator [Haloactinospora alba]